MYICKNCGETTYDIEDCFGYRFEKVQLESGDWAELPYTIAECPCCLYTEEDYKIETVFTVVK